MRCPRVPVMPDSFTIDDMVFVPVPNGGRKVSLFSYHGDAILFRVPSRVVYCQNEYEVVAIGDIRDAADDCPESDSDYVLPWFSDIVRSIFVADSVRILGRIYAKNLFFVSMGDNVTELLPRAFMGCPSIREVVFPESIIEIPDGLFQSCSELRHITIPDRVTRIGDMAFKSCTRLFSIDLPDSLRTIGNGAFFGCESLHHVSLRNGLTGIGRFAFHGCALQHVIIPETVSDIGERAFGGCSALRYLTFDNDTIPLDAFDGSTCVESVSIGPKVREIPDDAFCDWSRLMSVSLSEGLESIGECAFGSCPIRHIHIPGTVSLIGFSAFHRCSDLKTISVSTDNETYISYDGCLYDRGMMTLYLCPEGREGSVTIPAGVGTIDSCAFELCRLVTDISMSDDVVSIGMSAFEECTSLRSVRLSQSIDVLPFAVFANCESLEDVSLDCVESIGQDSMMGCLSLRELYIPDSVSEIDRKAFRLCSSLETVRLGRNVSYIAAYAFLECDSLAWVDVDSENPYFISVDGVVYTKDMKELVFHPPAMDIDSYVLPSTVEVVRAGAFIGCSGLRHLYVEEGNSEYVSVNGAIYTRDLTELVRYPVTDERGVVIRKGVEHILNDAFSSLGMESVVLPKGLRTIGGYAFFRCGGLRDILVPKSLKVLEQCSFYGCTSLRTIRFETGCDSIAVEGSAFGMCSADIGLEPEDDSVEMDFFEISGTEEVELSPMGLCVFEGVLGFGWYPSGSERCRSIV